MTVERGIRDYFRASDPHGVPRERPRAAPAVLLPDILSRPSLARGNELLRSCLPLPGSQSLARARHEEDNICSNG